MSQGKQNNGTLSGLPRTKIVCTLGPASSDVNTLERMLQAGMNVARLNFSHGDHAFHEKTLLTLRKASKRTGLPVGILQDLCGPKIRVGRLPGGFVDLKTEQTVTLQAGITKKEVGQDIIPIEYANLSRDVEPGARVLFDDGKLAAMVESVRGPAVKIRMIQGGRLKERKGLNLPDSVVSAPSVTAKDKRDMEWGLAQGVDFIALSFVRQADDLEPVRRRIAQSKRQPLLVSKIERPEAIVHMKDIIEASDVIMVARGDLGVEMPFQEVPLLQKRLISLANQLDVPVITATQMLESMTLESRPTRAEVSDVSNAIIDGSDAVMLSGETAVGAHPVATVAAMRKIAEETEQYLLCEGSAFPSKSRADVTGGLHDALALGAERISRSLEVKAIVGCALSGTTTRFLASARPRVPILGLSSSSEVIGRMCLQWSVQPKSCKAWKSNADLMRLCEKVVLDEGLARSGEMIVVVIGREGAADADGKILLHRIGGGRSSS